MYMLKAGLVRVLVLFLANVYVVFANSKEYQYDYMNAWTMTHYHVLYIA